MASLPSVELSFREKFYASKIAIRGEPSRGCSLKMKIVLQLSLNQAAFQ
jgi:hypothetical protein